MGKKRRNGKEPQNDGTYCAENCPYFKVVRGNKHSVDADCLKTGEPINYFDGFLQHCELEEEED